MKRNATLVKLFNQQSGACVYCGVDMDLTKTHTDNAPTIEHILPKARFGKISRNAFNLACACRKCNNDKGDLTLSQWIGKRMVNG